MDLRQLRAIVAIAEEGQFTRAADRLRITQPTLSAQVRQLEAELGLRLFHRTSRRVLLTDAGERLLWRARRVIAEVDDAALELQQIGSLLSGRVTIGLTQTPGPINVVGLLARFHARYGALELAVVEDLSIELAEQLRRDQLDLGILSVTEPVQRRGLEAYHLATEPLVVIVANDHRLASRESVTIADLADEDFVASPVGATIREAVSRAAATAGFRPRIAFESREVGRIRAIVAGGLGVGILPRSDAVSPGPAVRIVGIEDSSLTHRLALFWRHGRRHSPAARALLDQARSIAATLPTS